MDGSTIEGSADIIGTGVTTFTNLTVKGALNFKAQGTYDLDDCEIGSVKNESTGSVILRLLNGSKVDNNLGPNLTVKNIRNISVTGIVSGSRMRISKTDGDVEIFNQEIAGTSYQATYSEGVEYSTGDELEIRVAHISRLEFASVVKATDTGWSLIVKQEENSVYESYGVNGANVDGITWDGGNMEFDFDETDNVLEGGNIAAWYFNFITTETGIAEAFGAIRWPQINRISVRTETRAITFDNTRTQPLIITGAWINRDDGTSIISTNSNSIQIDPPAVFVQETTASGLTSDESGKLDAISNNTTLIPGLF